MQKVNRIFRTIQFETIRNGFCLIWAYLAGMIIAFMDDYDETKISVIPAMFICILLVACCVGVILRNYALTGEPEDIEDWKRFRQEFINKE